MGSTLVDTQVIDERIRNVCLGHLQEGMGSPGKEPELGNRSAQDTHPMPGRQKLQYPSQP